MKHIQLSASVEPRPHLSSRLATSAIAMWESKDLNGRNLREGPGLTKDYLWYDRATMPPFAVFHVASRLWYRTQDTTAFAVRLCNAYDIHCVV